MNAERTPQEIQNPQDKQARDAVELLERYVNDHRTNTAADILSRLRQVIRATEPETLILPDPLAGFAVY